MWDDLSAHASEPNPFYESWALLPAWKRLAGSLNIRIVLVFLDSFSSPTSRPLLIGLFPIAVRLRHEILHIRTAALWRHTHCPLTTPLLREGYERAALEGFLSLLDNDRSFGRVLSFELASGDGSFYHNLQTLVNDQMRQMFNYNEFSRPVFRPMADFETYFGSALSANSRKQFRKKYRDLSNSGKLETLELKSGDDLDSWLESFLVLEASGWKGKQGTAIASSISDTLFFQEFSKGAFDRGRLQMLMLQFKGKPVAMQYNLISCDGAFCLKLAYDETYERSSPGFLLDVEALKILHGRKDIPWMDSCRSAPVFDILERIWIERRLVRHILVSTSDRIGRSILRLLPTARRLQRALQSWTQKNPV